VISNTVWVGERLPCLTYGMRGMVTASIEVGPRGARVGRGALGRATRGQVLAGESAGAAAAQLMPAPLEAS
jgi:hypothetical protein